ncbi:hypothetical protein CPB85DRAFT_1326703, partial [Mucidula mucida]
MDLQASFKKTNNSHPCTTRKQRNFSHPKKVFGLYDGRVMRWDFPYRTESLVSFLSPHERKSPLRHGGNELDGSTTMKIFERPRASCLGRLDPNEAHDSQIYKVLLKMRCRLNGLASPRIHLGTALATMHPPETVYERHSPLGRGYTMNKHIDTMTDGRRELEI